MSRKKIFSAPIALIVIMVTALIFGGISVSADDAPKSGVFGENHLTWSLDDNGVLTITGTGAMPDFAKGETPWQSVRPEIKSVVIGDGVTSVGSYAFTGCSMITSLVLGADVATVGEYAFQECTALASITFDDNLVTIEDYAFRRNPALTEVSFSENSNLASVGNYSFQDTGITSLTLPSTVTYLGTYAFYECKGLTTVDLTFDSNPAMGIASFYCCSNIESVSLKGNITTIGSSMFSSCPKLTKLELGENVTVIGNSAFANCGFSEVVLPDSVTTIEDSAFFSCNNLSKINKPANLTKIGRAAFCGDAFVSAIIYSDVTYGDSVYSSCHYLTNVEISNGVTRIPNIMFEGCKELKSITIPGTVTSIGSDSFASTGLTSVTLPASVKLIDKRAFNSCKSLTEINLNEGLETIGPEAFDYCSALTAISVPSTVKKIGTRAFACTTSVKEITLTINSGTTIGSELFSGCSGVEKITINGTVTDLGDKAFSGCINLKSITLPEGLTRIGKSMFDGCTGLTTVKIPDGVKTIDENAFNRCTHITQMVIPSGVETIGSGAFGSTPITGIVIPDSVVSIGTGAFANCKDLASVTLSKNLTNISSNAFKCCSSLEDIEIPDSVTQIDESAFAESGLTSVVIPGTVNIVSGSAFNSCKDLKIVDMREGVNIIGAYSFAGCTALETVFIPSTVDTEDLASTAFNNCDNIATIQCTAEIKALLSEKFADASYIIISAGGYTDATVVGHSITLTADIGLNFYVYLPQEYDVNNTEVTFTWGEKDNEHNVKCSIVPSELHGANYKVTCNVAAKEMTDTITMVITSGADEVVSNQYSVVKYMNILSKAYPYDNEINGLLMAMALYGTRAQYYFKYHTDFTVLGNSQNSYKALDAYRTEVENYCKSVDSSAVDPANLTMMNIDQYDLGLKFYGASVTCTSQTKMRFYFEITDQSKFSAVTASIESQDLQFIRRSVNGKSLVYLETPGLAAGALENAIVINIGGVDFTYDYLYYVQRCSADYDGFTNTAKAIYAVSHYARLYEGGSNNG